jgi:predicted ATPase
MWPALRGLVMFYFIRGQLATARELGEELLTLARSAQDHAMLVEAHHALGWTLFWRGEFARAGEVLAEGVATYDRERHGAHAFLYGQDPGISSLVAWALALWHLGYSNEARTKMEQALGLARELAHPYTLAFTLFAAAWFHMHLRDARGAQELADAAIAIAAEQEFPHARAIATAMRGWALVEQGQVEEGIAEMHQGLVAADTIGATIDGLSIMGLLAEACGRTGHTENGVAELARALERARAIEGCYYEAELHRIEGELLLKRSHENGGEAEACFLYALEVARRQQARSVELRAATSLARLLRDEGRRAEARDVLAPVYAWFSEGFDTRDLVEAKALLEELG